ncbi:Autophagy-related protein 9 [Exophiala dermatitidis]
MASNIFSRFTGSNNPSASIYDTIRQTDEESEASVDIEERAGLVPRSQTAQQHGYQDFEANSPDIGLSTRIPHAHAESTSPDIGSSTRIPPARAESSSAVNNKVRSSRKDKSRTQYRPRWNQAAAVHKLLDVEEADDEVPASLLIDHNASAREHGSISLPPPPSELSDGLTARADTTRPFPAQPHRPSSPNDPRHPPRTAPVPATFWGTWGTLANADPKEKAMFRWVNVVNLDNFLLEVYTYYVYHGFWSILLMRFLNLVTVAFVVGFSLFLTQCINYRDVRGSTKMSEILVPQCGRNMGFVPSALLWLTTFIWIWKSAVYILDIPRLRHMHDFYHYLLDIPEEEIQSISWQEIVSRLMALRDSNPTITSTSNKRGAYIRSQDKQRMDAHDIANRLMRRQNYLIAMINKDILDLTLPIPFLRNRKLFTRTLEWNIDVCIMDFVFNRKGQVRTLFLKDTHRKDLCEALRKRFILAGVASLIFAPFLTVFFILKHFFENFNEYQKNPAQIGSREYSRFAQWKFREFNELYHLFQRRINMSYPFATRYLNQFPKDKTIQAAQFVSLVSGAVVSVLGLATILDQENFLNFEVTPGRTTIFYLGIFGSIWAVARGVLPDDNMVYDTSLAIQEVIQFTHYEPQHWAGRLHTMEVKQEFSQLYQMKLVLFLEEVLSMIFTPFVLWFSLPKCSERIIDFFREFTVHVDGLGYVCSFAEFNFMQQPYRPAAAVAVDNGTGQGAATAAAATTATGNSARTVTADNNVNLNINPREDYFASKDNKLEHSYWGFMNDYARNPKTDIRFPYTGSAGRRRPFNMPPPVPGLPSPLFPNSDHPQQRGSSGAVSGLGSPPSALYGHGHAVHPSTHLPPAPPSLSKQQHLGATSPLQSLLLDPHHQPLTVSTSGGGGGQTTVRNRGGGSGARSEAARHDVVSPHVTATAARQSQSQRAPPPPSSDGQERQGEVEAKIHRQEDEGDEEGELGSWKYEVERRRKKSRETRDEAGELDDSDSDQDDDDEDDEDNDLHTITALGGALGPLGLIRQFQKAQAQGGGRTRVGGVGVGGASI